MKKVTSVLIFIVMLICSVFAITGCSDKGSNSQTNGVQYKKYKGDDFYTVYKYVGKAEETVDLSLLNKDGVVIKAIADEAFKGVNGIKKIICPDTIETIGEKAFAEMNDLEELVVPFIGKNASGDAIIGSTAAKEDKAVDIQRTIYYWFGTEEYASGTTISGVKFNSTATEATYYLPKGLKTISISPKAEYTIPAYAFYKNILIKTLNVSDKVKGVGQFSLSGCENLKVIKKGETDFSELISDLQKGSDSITKFLK